MGVCEVSASQDLSLVDITKTWQMFSSSAFDSCILCAGYWVMRAWCFAVSVCSHQEWWNQEQLQWGHLAVSSAPVIPICQPRSPSEAPTELILTLLLVHSRRAVHLAGGLHSRVNRGPPSPANAWSWGLGRVLVGTGLSSRKQCAHSWQGTLVTQWDGPLQQAGDCLTLVLWECRKWEFYS